MTIENTTDIAKPPSDVYSFLLDKENITLWLSNFDVVEHLNGEEGAVGSTYKIFLNERTGQVEMLMTIEEAVDCHIIISTLINEDLDIKLIANITPLSEIKTRLDVIMHYDPKRIGLKLHTTIFGKALTRRHSSDLERLKSAIEMLDASVPISHHDRQSNKKQQ